jgi:hypothetical protein
MGGAEFVGITRKGARLLLVRSARDAKGNGEDWVSLWG